MASTERPSLLNVLLVRHGESVNNTIMSRIFAPVRNEPPDSDAYRRADKSWLEHRQDDPSLTDKGAAEAEQLARVYAPRLTQDPGTHVHIFVSPFLRTLQTAAPLAAALGSERCTVKVHTDLFEVGGVYTQQAGGRGGPGRCLSAQEIEERWPAYDASTIPGPREAQWYSQGWETDSEARVRARKLAAWLRSPSLRAECATRTTGQAWAVLVVHGCLIDNLVKALLGTEDDAAGDHPGDNVISGRSSSISTPNTATGHFVVKPGPGEHAGPGRVVLYTLGCTAHLAADGGGHALASLSPSLAAAAVAVFAVGLAVGVVAGGSGRSSALGRFLPRILQ